MKFRQAFIRVVSFGVFKQTFNFHEMSYSESRSSSRLSCNQIKENCASFQSKLGTSEEILKSVVKEPDYKRKFLFMRKNSFAKHISIAIDQNIEVTSVWIQILIFLYNISFSYMIWNWVCPCVLLFYPFNKLWIFIAIDKIISGFTGVVSLSYST